MFRRKKDAEELSCGFEVEYKQKQLTPLTVYQHLGATYKPKGERFVYFLNTARIVQIRT